MANDDANHAMLRDAVARGAAVELSLPSAGLFRHYRSRFLGETVDGVWVESIPAEQALIRELLAAGGTLGVAFRSGASFVAMDAPVRRCEPQFAVNVGTVVEALLLARPAQIRTVQRRDNFRVRVPAGSGLAVRVWRISSRASLADRPMDAQEIRADVRDLSTGGLGLTFHGSGGEPPKVTGSDRLRIEMIFQKVPLLLEGQMRFPVGKLQGEHVEVGIQFAPLDRTHEGRQALARLNRIIGEFQRDALRRERQAA